MQAVALIKTRSRASIRAVEMWKTLFEEAQHRKQEFTHITTAPGLWKYGKPPGATAWKTLFKEAQHRKQEFTHSAAEVYHITTGLF